MLTTGELVIIKMAQIVRYASKIKCPIVEMLGIKAVGLEVGVSDISAKSQYVGISEL